MIGMAVFLAGCNTAVDLEQRVDELYDRMSQEERIAQLRSMYMDDLFDEAGQLDTAKCHEMIPNGIGHFSQFCLQQPRDPNDVRDRVAAVQQWLKENTPSGIPALFHEEVLSGINTLGATIYPQQIGQACSFNTELAELKTRQTSTALRKMGGVLALSPMVDVCRIPSFNRLEESYGEDGYLSAAMGVAFVKGLQQGDLKKGVGACSKHYLGYGGGGDADEKVLMEEILMPHEAMIRLAGSKCLMPGYHAMRREEGRGKNEALDLWSLATEGTQESADAKEMVNCVANSWILQDILRNYLGFDGMVVSDYTAIDQLPAPVNHIHESDNSTAANDSASVDGGFPAVIQKAAAAINAGNDVDFPFGANYEHLQQAIDQGLVGSEAFERAVKDVLRFKLRAGFFDNDAYLYSTEHIVLDTPEERQTAYNIATQSVVLLENNDILPLSNLKSKTSNLNILLTGPNANSIWAMCGDYTYPAMSYFWKKVDYTSEKPHIVTLLEGMKNCLNDQTTNTPTAPFNLLYSRGCDWTEEIETDFIKGGDARAWEYEILHRKVHSGEKADKAEALAMARQADVIIAAVGENVMLCGENRDRKGLRLPGSQEQYVEELIKTGKPVVLVMFGGRAQVVSGLAEKCAAVIQAWYPGEEGGNAVADILFGKVSPSAKLSVSYPNAETYEPLCYNNPAEMADSKSSDSKLSNCKSSNSKFSWPFGYGLSDTTFEYGNLKADKEAMTTDQDINLSFEVKNTGKTAADEVVQIYLAPASVQQPIRPIQLQGFARVSLQPGESKTVEATLYTEQFGYYTHEDQRRWNVAPGEYIVKIGASSQDIRLQQTIALKGNLVQKPLREFYFSKTKVNTGF